MLTKGPFEFRVVETPRTAPEAYSSYQVGVVMGPSCDCHMTWYSYRVICIGGVDFLINV